MLETLLILDFGSQYTQLIARRIRELNVYCEIHPFNKIPPINEHIKGIILSGSPYSVRNEDRLEFDLNAFRGTLPILGICYGAQYIADTLGGNVERSSIREYGRSHLQMQSESRLLKNIPNMSQVWMSHGDTITSIPEGFSLTAGTEDIPVAAFENETDKLYAIQFHPEVTHSDDGATLLSNFVIDINIVLDLFLE
jgi:GMP synthase (glutamine-hydrolysing)